MGTAPKTTDIAVKSALPRGEVDLENLYRCYRDRIARYVARNFGAGPPDPDDAVQNAFEKFAALAEPQKVENPEAFLRRSARNYVLDQHRRLAVRTAYAQEISRTEEKDDFDSARVLEAKERWQIIETAIQDLDARKREMLILNRIHGLSCAEIARRKRCSATLVKIEIAKALLACERALREAEGE